MQHHVSHIHEHCNSETHGILPLIRLSKAYVFGRIVISSDQIDWFHQSDICVDISCQSYIDIDCEGHILEIKGTEDYEKIFDHFFQDVDFIGWSPSKEEIFKENEQSHYYYENNTDSLNQSVRELIGQALMDKENPTHELTSLVEDHGGCAKTEKILIHHEGIKRQKVVLVRDQTGKDIPIWISILSLTIVSDCTEMKELELSPPMIQERG